MRVAHEQAAVTHRHPRSLACSSLYCLWARRVMQASESPWEEAVAALRAVLPQGSKEPRELDKVILPATGLPPGGTGYVVDALHSARRACQEAGYESVVRRAIFLGHDTDTTACIAGGIAALQHGIKDIPKRWRDGLHGWMLLDPLLARARERWN